MNILMYTGYGLPFSNIKIASLIHNVYIGNCKKGLVQINLETWKDLVPSRIKLRKFENYLRSKISTIVNSVFPLTEYKFLQLKQKKREKKASFILKTS